MLDSPELFVASRAKCLDLLAIINKKIGGRWKSERAETPKNELKESDGVEDDMGILCTGTVVEERNEGSGETFMEHRQSSQKQKRKRPHDKVQ